MMCAINMGDVANAASLAFAIGGAVGVIFTLWVSSLDLGRKP